MRPDPEDRKLPIDAPIPAAPHEGAAPLEGPASHEGLAAPGPRSGRHGALQLVLGAVVISFSPIFVRSADVGPTAAGFYRMLFGGGALLIAVALRRDPLWRGWRPLGYAAAAAAFFAVDLACWHRAIGYVGPGLATILGNFQIFFLAAFGIVVFREGWDTRYLLSIPLAILGLVLIVGVGPEDLDRDSRLGLLFGFATAVTYAAYVLVLQKSQAGAVRLSPLSNLTVISFVTAAFLAGESAALGESFHVPDRWSWTAMVAYGVLCQALGWLLISRGLTTVPASRAGLILILQPMLAFVWDILIFSRPTGIQGAAGAVIAGAAIWMGVTSRRAPRRPPLSP